MSKIAGAILNFVTNLESFTTRDIQVKFAACPFSILKEAVQELEQDKKVFRYGQKRGTFYSVKEGLDKEENEDELSPKLITEVEKFVKSKREFTSTDLFAYIPSQPEHELRKILVYLRDEKGILWLHGHGRTSIWSQHQELPEEEISEEDKENVDLKTAILEFAQTNLRWFKRSELDEIVGNSAYEVRQALYSLMDDGEIQMRGEKRTTEYAYYEVIDEVEEEEESTSADPELTKNILEHIESIGVVTIPQLIEKFTVARNKIVRSLRELEEQEQIYHEGIKKTSRYIHKDVTEDKAKTIVKEIQSERKETVVAKAIDRLSEILLVNAAVYITFINKSQKYELRSTHQSGTKVLFASENPDEVIAELLLYTKGVEVELAV